MKFSSPAGMTPADGNRWLGRPLDRIDGPLKTSGAAPYAGEFRDGANNHGLEAYGLPAYGSPAYGFIVGAGVAKGKITRLDVAAAKRAPGVLAVLSTLDFKRLPLGKMNVAALFGGADIQHYHQAIALVVAKTFEQARAAACLLEVRYAVADGEFDLHAAAASAPYFKGEDHPSAKHVREVEKALAEAEVSLDQTYTTPDQTHAMMEPFATVAQWRDGVLNLWTANQMIAWGKRDIAITLGISAKAVRLHAPFIGGGFGGKLFVRADAALAALGARETKMAVKVVMARPTMINNSTHRAATIQRIRIGATRAGKMTAIAHESISGNVRGGEPEEAVSQTRLLYGVDSLLASTRLAHLDLPEANAMRAPGEGAGMMALEVAMDEMAEKLALDPVEFRILNDTQVDPQNPQRKFSQRKLVECLHLGAERFGWSKRKSRLRPGGPGGVRDGDWLVGMGMAVGFRDSPLLKSGARVRLDAAGTVTVETDMTDIGTGSYTIIAQTVAETLGVPIERVVVRLGDSELPVSAGSGGQFGAASSTGGVFAACMKLRETAARKLGVNSADAEFFDGNVRSGNFAGLLAEAAKDGEIVEEDALEPGNLTTEYQVSTFAGHFVEVGVDRFTGEVRVRRMLAVCSAGRILNPKSARSQVIGAMTMGVGSALMEELHVDTHRGFFVNHDLAGYEVPVHADIPHQDVIFLDGDDPIASPLKAKGVGELGLCGVAAAIANAVYNATGVRVRDYPLTMDKLIGGLPATG